MEDRRPQLHHGRQVELISAGSYRAYNAEGVGVHIVQLACGSNGAHVAHVQEHHVVLPEDWCWEPMSVGVVYILGLGIPHMGAEEIVDICHSRGYL